MVDSKAMRGRKQVHRGIGRRGLPPNWIDPFLYCHRAGLKAGEVGPEDSPKLGLLRGPFFVVPGDQLQRMGASF